MLRSAVGMTHALRSRLVMDYTTSYLGDCVAMQSPIVSIRQDLSSPASAVASSPVSASSCRHTF